MTLEFGASKRKSRKLTKKQSRIRFLQRIPPNRRWWSLWQSNSSETVSAVVSEPPCGSSTELLWSRGHFEKNIIRWMTEFRDSELVSPDIFGWYNGFMFVFYWMKSSRFILLDVMLCRWVKETFSGLQIRLIHRNQDQQSQTRTIFPNETILTSRAKTV